MPYKYKALKVNGKRIDEHRFVMEQHLGVKLSREQHVHHKNENKRDNRIENLEVIHRSAHVRMHRVGRKMSPSTRWRLSKSLSKLTETDIVSILSLLASGERQKTIALRFGVAPSTIRGVKSRDRWLNENTPPIPGARK